MMLTRTFFSIDNYLLVVFFKIQFIYLWLLYINSSINKIKYSYTRSRLEIVHNDLLDHYYQSNFKYPSETLNIVRGTRLITEWIVKFNFSSYPKSIIIQLGSIIYHPRCDILLSPSKLFPQISNHWQRPWYLG